MRRPPDRAIVLEYEPKNHILHHGGVGEASEMSAPDLWSIGAIANETGHDRRTVARVLAGVKADGELAGGHAGWLTKTVIAAFRAYDRRARDDDQSPDADFAKLLGTGQAVEDLLVRLRAEASIAQRRRMVQAEGRVVGELEQAMITAASSDDIIAGIVRDTLIEQTACEIMYLCEWRLDESGRHPEHGNDIG